MMIMEPNTTRATTKHAEGEREEIVGLVRRAGNVQEKHEVHAHLADRENGQQNRHGGRPHELASAPPRRRRGSARWRSRAPSDSASGLRGRPAPPPGARSCSARSCGHVQPSAGSQVDDREHADPDDIERMPEQAEAEQPANDHGAKAERRDLRHHRQQPQQARASRAIRGSPTSAKKADRKALRVGPAPLATIRANSETSSPMKAAPSRKVTTAPAKAPASFAVRSRSRKGRR